MLVVGVDENGLGPRLGPLIATSVAFEAPRYDRARFMRAGERAGIDDSKQTSGFGKMAPCESIALAAIERVYGKAPGDCDELLALVSLDGLLGLRAPCPSASRPQCWSHTLPLPVFGGELSEGRKRLARLTRLGLRLAHARVAIACAAVLNAEVARLGSRTSVDLSLFERLLLDARAAAGAPLEAVAGMVGGIRDYPRYLQRLRDRACEALPAPRGSRRYRIDRLGVVSFEIDADAHHLPVALASMIGKYVRELLMERQNRFYLAHLPALIRASGYHDPKTRRFVSDSASLRRRLGIADRCFER